MLRVKDLAARMQDPAGEIRNYNGLGKRGWILPDRWLVSQSPHRPGKST